MILQDYLHFLHSLAQDYAGGNFFNFHIMLTQTLGEFVAMAETGKAGMVKAVRKFDLIVEKEIKRAF